MTGVVVVDHPVTALAKMNRRDKVRRFNRIEI
jgi:hypothetical protein